MTSEPPSPRPLNVPAAHTAHYAKNFIRQAVCELRFPTLFELESDRPPQAFSKALRKEYPSYELLNDVNLNLGGVAHANAHAFRSRRRRWSVILRASALSLETSRYDAFDNFAKRLAFVLEAAKATIDSDFFTRVGLRYINAFPFSSDEINQWVNPALVSPLGEGTFGDVDEHSQTVRGITTAGGYRFQHGLATGGKEYFLDFDFYREDVTVAETLNVVRTLHELEFSMFLWSLGPKARQDLGPSTLKGNG